MNIQTYEPKGGWMAYYRRKDFFKALCDAAVVATLTCLIVLLICMGLTNG